ncbi:hypothetical protein GCM10020254_16270 [Streptomyces goshikiensis]
MDAPWRELPARDREWILFTEEQPVVTVHPVREAERIQRPYQGTYMSAHRYVMRTFADSKSASLRARAEKFLTDSPCPVCEGRRLRPEALAVTFAGRTIAELAAVPLTELDGVLASAPPGGEAARVLAEDLRARIAPVTELGLGYLSLDRTAPSLSAGELQRLRLATQLKSGLFGVVYVLDEPSAGAAPGRHRGTADRTGPAEGGGEHGVRGGARLGRGAARGLAGGRRAAGRGARRAGPAQRAAGGAGGRGGVGDGAAPVRLPGVAGASAPGPGGTRCGPAQRGRPAQSARGDGRVPARGVHRRDRGVGFREVHAGGPGPRR